MTLYHFTTFKIKMSQAGFKQGPQISLAHFNSSKQ